MVLSVISMGICVSFSYNLTLCQLALRITTNEQIKLRHIILYALIFEISDDFNKLVRLR